MTEPDRDHAALTTRGPAGSEPEPRSSSDGRAPTPAGREDDRGDDRRVPPAPLGNFRLLSDLGDNLAVARWRPGRFDCDPELLDRAAIVTALGDVVGSDRGLPGLAATTSPSDPMALLLTLIRSARVLYCRVSFGGPEPTSSSGFTLTMATGRQEPEIG